VDEEIQVLFLYALEELDILFISPKGEAPMGICCNSDSHNSLLGKRILYTVYQSIPGLSRGKVYIMK
jgi:hypothetical protein